MTLLLPVFAALGALGLFGIGAMFGGWLVESDQKRTRAARAVPLMEIVEQADGR